MLIGLDVSAAGINQAGTGTYVRSLADALPEYAPDWSYHFFSVGHRQDMSGPKTPRVRLHTLYRDLVWMHMRLPWEAARANLDLLHMPANVMPLLRRGPTVVTILDTTVQKFPEQFTRWHRWYSRIFMPASARAATLILTISESSKRDLVRHLHVSADRVVVTPLAAAPIFQPVAAAEVEAFKARSGLGDYLLTVGALEPRKNLIGLLRALARLREAGCAYPLVHAGPPGWLYAETLAEMRRLGLEDSVRFLGHVPAADLVRLYAAARVFVYPSRYEGFGLPVLEAMACGAPVITSKVSSLPEVVGQAGWLVDPGDTAQIAEAIQRIWEDRDLAARLAALGLEQARRFSWRRCAQETAAAYRQALLRARRGGR